MHLLRKTQRVYSVRRLVDLQKSLCDAASGKGSPLDIAADLRLQLDAALAVAGAIDADVRVRAHVAESLALAASFAASLLADIDVAVDPQAAVDARIAFVDELCGKDAKVGLLGAVTGLVGGLLCTVTNTLVDTLAGLSVSLHAHLAVDVDAIGDVVLCAAPSPNVSASVDVDLALSGPPRQGAGHPRGS